MFVFAVIILILQTAQCKLSNCFLAFSDITLVPINNSLYITKYFEGIMTLFWYYCLSGAADYSLFIALRKEYKFLPDRTTYGHSLE